MGFLTEFKDFVAKGNVVDLAIGVVIGAAFGKIVSSLVDGVVMPIISIFTGGVNVTDWKHVLHPAVLTNGKETAAEVAIKYGDFLQQIINFLIIALVVFMFIKAYNKMRAPAAAAGPSETERLLTEIRDNLKR